MDSRLTAPVGGGNSPDVREIAAPFLRLGCTAFGGPSAHVTLMEAELVAKRGWLTRAEFLDLLGVVQVLPGPNSTELAVHIGHSRGGWRGGMVAGLCFVVPSVLLIWLLASVAATPALRPVVVAVLWWLAPVVVAVLCEAQWKFGSQAWQRPFATVVMYLQRDLVDSRHWLTLEALTQASSLAQITPGPLFATATAAGYVIGGHAGALVATIGIFAPAFVSVAVSAPIRRLIQRSPAVRAALDGVVVASVALLGRAIVGFSTPLGTSQWLVCLLASLLLFVGRVQATLLLVGAVLAGLVPSLLHFTPS